MVPLLSEQLQSLTAASRLLPGRPHVSTLWRWANRGLKGVKLETVLVGGKRYTSAEALQRFVARLSSPPDAPAPSRPSPARTARAGQVEKELAALGL